MHINVGNNVCTTALAVILTLSPAAALAATAVPAPGESLLPANETAEANLANEVPASQSETGQETRFTLTKITVRHEGMELSETDLAAITDPLLNREISSMELNNAVNSLTVYARSHGYPAAMAYIPEQTAVEGRLTVDFAPGRFGDISLNTNGVMKEAVAERSLKRLKPGNVITAYDLENSLRNLKDIPGVNVNGVISPGTGQGESNLRVDLQKDTAGTYVIYAENYGSRAAGRYRYGLQADWKNLGGTGARLNLGGLISNSNQRGFNIAYEIPVGHSMTTLGIGYSHSDYELGSVWSQLGVEGKSDTISLYGKTPLDNRSFRSANLVYGVNYRKLKDEFNGWDIGDRHSYSFNVGLEGTGRTARNALQYNVSLITGNVIPDSDIADTIGTLGDTKGHFTKGTFDLTGVQQLSGPFDLMVKLSGQMAGHNLDSSEHIYLGGARGVRAYPQGEASGDAGLLGTAELRYHTKLPGLTLSLYYDAGNVKTEKNGNDSTTLKGWGIGVTYSKPNDWFARFDYARRIGFDEGLSDDADSRQRMWFLLGKMF